MSFEKQKNALNDMYQQQSRHILKNREKMINELKELDDKLKARKNKYEEDLTKIKEDGKSKLNAQWLLFTLVHNIGKIQKFGTMPG